VEGVAAAGDPGADGGGGGATPRISPVLPKGVGVGGDVPGGGCGATPRISPGFPNGENGAAGPPGLAGCPIGPDPGIMPGKGGGGLNRISAEGDPGTAGAVPVGPMAGPEGGPPGGAGPGGVIPGGVAMVGVAGGVIPGGVAMVGVPPGPPGGVGAEGAPAATPGGGGGGGMLPAVAVSDPSGRPQSGKGHTMALPATSLPHHGQRLTTFLSHQLSQTVNGSEKGGLAPSPKQVKSSQKRLPRGACPPFSQCLPMARSEKGDRHRRQTPQPLQNQALDGASPHFRTPVLTV